MGCSYIYFCSSAATVAASKSSSSERVYFRCSVSSMSRVLEDSGSKVTTLLDAASKGSLL